jgi:hypothetical protein
MAARLALRSACPIQFPMRGHSENICSAVLVSVLTRNGRGICKEMDAVQSHVLGVVCSDSKGDERKYQS